MTTCAEAKRRLRARMQRQRRAVPAGERARIGEAVAARVLASARFAEARRVAGYVSLDDEVPTAMLLHAVLASGRPLLLPCAHPEGRLEFVAVSELATLRPGRFGVREPPPSAPSRLGSGDLVLVPGVAFDRHGGRLGRGAGLYDRSLSGAGLVVGIAYAFQLVDEVPMADHDRRVDAVVTEGETWCLVSSSRPGPAC
jgi:5-formyltetrahydrofolate cyclo-ligase